MHLARRRLRVEGREAAYVEEGPPDAAPVVLLHGGGFDHAGLTWQATIAELKDRFRLIVPDLPGYGETAGFGCPHDLTRLGHWLEAFLDAKGLDRVDLAGVSMGGGMALWLAAERPARVRRVVAVGAYGIMARAPFHALARLTFRARAGPLVYHLAGRSRLLARAGLAISYHDARRIDPEVVEELMAVSREQAKRLSFLDFLTSELGPDALATDLRPALGRVTAPVLLVHGTSDKVVPIRHARAACPLFARARLLELPTGHWPMRERPDLFNPAFAAFLVEG
ncbi:pimeloyl-ACP methyl ester carboxylesterase [Palleronia aestuarii]|uniref:Pimeloyl-ACP methyl ester carboxylesterase n=1 Tax=Palleronia aestuarii TaxID=568105 RepID=A0A2W7NHN6_9RHOB|nr:alpha/beta fold hydrolase [Palleronia aestuarii]PZX19951.1 pimeloyl-ACP methyl ester carboxylesterase [Palleronia aestuarii]